MLFINSDITSSWFSLVPSSAFLKWQKDGELDAAFLALELSRDVTGKSQVLLISSFRSPEIHFYQSNLGWSGTSKFQMGWGWGGMVEGFVWPGQHYQCHLLQPWRGKFLLPFQFLFGPRVGKGWILRSVLFLKEQRVGGCSGDCECSLQVSLACPFRHLG